MNEYSLSAKSSKNDYYYDVEIKIDAQYLSITCECEAYKRGKLCRHLLPFINGKCNGVYDENDSLYVTAIYNGIKSQTQEKYKIYTSMKSIIDNCMFKILDSEFDESQNHEKLIKMIEKMKNINISD
ncbi:TPA: hypothetical protein N3A08_003529 [Salmonella enterica subsp. salamae serovar 9,46:z4,z24:z39:z42]|nr:hypothetical protein [Salmonella enterica subsp. salamae serovar 9,46:z4,z24:z39:z42]